ncbi:DNA polymerase [Vallitalea longa]|uniref:DNA-directed DNA polymerase n=1 Tax=Vallitalea longa TaxID=2936439 RepID=A0A9W5YAS4_9FIRM|nr:DNA polymerase [Vallitalea longa]GKX27868.1 DNA polymerase [Vallitalea longa]
MRTLAIDIETYSGEDITKVGVYKYVDSPDFEILLFAYAFDDESVQVIDLAQGEELPNEVLEALYNSKILKTAYNAQFERVAISKYMSTHKLGIKTPINPNIPVQQWECTMVKASMLGMPLGLDKVAKVLHLENQKMKAGKALINYFSKPCKPTKKNCGRTRNLPQHDMDKWNTFKEYNRRDVEVERDIRNKIRFFEIPKEEKQMWYLDQNINDMGIKLNIELVVNAINLNNTYTDRLMKQLKEITGVENPNSVTQLKKWILDITGIEVKSLSKTAIPELLEQTDNSELRKVLKIRQKLAKTSVKKYEAMNRAICTDGRVRGLLQFYGANRTGRWAGRLVQVQNLPKNKISDLDLARNIVIDNDLELLEMLYGNVPSILSQLVRTAFIASNNSRFIVADFSAIEARVIAWLANEKWRMQVFATHGKIYEASASQMFHVPIEQITKGSDLRAKGKVAELALGYQGGPGALMAMGALDMGIDEEELQNIVDAWRNANKAIVRLWRTIGNAAVKAVDQKIPVRIQYGITFYYRKGFLFVRLPSGRDLAYMRACVENEPGFGKRLVYEGMDQTSKQWKRITTYGGKLTENIVQAIARDCLRETMLRLDEVGYKTVMHVHDEVILDTPYDDKYSMGEVLKIMSEPIEWVPGLLLKGDGYETKYYLKD